MDDKTRDSENSTTLSRRNFIKATTLAAGAVGVAGTIGACRLGMTKGGETSNGLPITMAGYNLDRTEALFDGKVNVDGCDFQIEEQGIGDLNTHVFSGPQTLDVTEIGLHPYMLAYANEGFRDYSLLPIYPLRLFRHKSIFIRTDRGIKGPEDLRGRKVATPGFSSTSLTWLRGIVQHEYGVRPEEIQWYVSAKDSSAEAAGKVSKQESMVPKGLSVSQGPEGKDESDMLESGEVDALFHAAEPRAYIEGHPKVARLFPDFRKTERAYFKKTVIFPIMHAVAIRNTLVEQHPWLPESVFKAYSQAKQIMYDRLKKMGWATLSLPWAAQEIEETRALMGENFWPYGIEPNRKALEALFQYSYEQGLSSRELTIEEVFHQASLKLSENFK
ncbi:MAG: twin-arginine translocation signal domain-containing protein [Desulfobacterales bacterium]|jgi:4,5-dihydroxyphthalate decarboxylase